MKLNLTIELPLRNPDEVLDMDRVRDVLDSNFVNTMNNQPGFPVLDKLTNKELSDEAFFLSTTVGKSIQEVAQGITKIKRGFPESVDFDPLFPETLVQEQPELPKHWTALRNDFNALREAVLNLFEPISHLSTNAGALKDMVQAVVSQGLPESEQLKASVAKLQEELAKSQTAAQQTLADTKDAYDVQIERWRQRLHEKDKLFNLKDRRVAELERQLEATQKELAIVQETLAEMSGQVSNKYSDFQELNKYIGELFKDKRRMLALIQEKDALVGRLQDELRELRVKAGLPVPPDAQQEARQRLKMLEEQVERQSVIFQSFMKQRDPINDSVLALAPPEVTEPQGKKEEAKVGLLQSQVIAEGGAKAEAEDKPQERVKGSLLTESLTAIELSRLYREKMSQIFGSNRRLLDASQIQP